MGQITYRSPAGEIKSRRDKNDNRLKDKKTALIYQNSLREMEEFVPLTPEETDWLKTEVVPHYIWYDKTMAYCSACEKSIGRNAVKPVHCKEGICPVCHQKIIFRNINRKQDILDIGTGIIPKQVEINGKAIFTLRWCRVERRYYAVKAGGYTSPKFSISEEYRTLYHPKETPVWYEDYRWGNICGWQEVQVSNSYYRDYNTHGYLSSESGYNFMSQQYAKAVTGTWFETCHLDKFFERVPKNRSNLYSANWWLNLYANHTVFRWLVHQGWNQLADSCVLDTFTPARKWIGTEKEFEEHHSINKSMKITKPQFEFLKTIEDPAVELIEKMQKNRKYKKAV